MQSFKYEYCFRNLPFLRALISCYQLNPAKWKLKLNVKCNQKANIKSQISALEYLAC